VNALNGEGIMGSGAALGRLLAVAARAREEEVQRRRKSLDPEAYEEVFRRTAEGMRETQKRLARERKHGQAQWTVLERHPQARRLVMIRNDRRLHAWGLYKVLLERSHALAGRHPHAAADLAQLALTVAKCLDPGEHGQERTTDFKAGALAALADAKRRLADHEGAWQAFEAARGEVEAGSGDPLERAELEALRARLLRDFGPAAEAEQSLHRAGKLFRRIGDQRPERDLLDDTAHGVTHRRARG
jgi:hypothetical protein